MDALADVTGEPFGRTLGQALPGFRSIMWPPEPEHDDPAAFYRCKPGEHPSEDWSKWALFFGEAISSGAFQIRPRCTRQITDRLRAERCLCVQSEGSSGATSTTDPVWRSCFPLPLEQS